MKERKKINLIHYCNLSYALAFFINQYVNKGTDRVNPGVGPLCCMVLDQIRWRVELDNKNKFTAISQQKLADTLRIHVSTVYKYVDYLIKLGILEKKLVGHNITAFRINYEKLQSIIDEAEKRYFPDKTDDNDVEDLIPDDGEEETEEKTMAEYRKIKQQVTEEAEEKTAITARQVKQQPPSIFEDDRDYYEEEEITPKADKSYQDAGYEMNKAFRAVHAILHSQPKQSAETKYIESKSNDIRKDDDMPIVTNTRESLTDEEFTNAVLYKILPYYDELPENLKNVTLYPDKTTLRRKDDGQLTGRITNVKWESVETEKCPHCGFPVPKISKIKCPHCGDVLVRAAVRDEDGITRFRYR